MRKLAPLLLILGLCACGSSGAPGPTGTTNAGATGVGSTGAGPTGGGHRVGFSTSGTNGVECDIAASDVYCVQRPHVNPTTGIEEPVTGVSMTPSTTPHICQGTECRRSSGGKALAVGDHAGIGPWKCTVSRDGVRCTDKKTGKGFLISATGVLGIG
ncbi:MAG: hypothetical protein QOG85_362 [Gaiellaceae bacterium]|jgi:hypothetical protein|nr:hypothetical protein [Gaiellaceae bacterium]